MDDDEAEAAGKDEAEEDETATFFDVLVDKPSSDWNWAERRNEGMTDVSSSA